LAESNFYAWRREIALRDRESTAATGRDDTVKQAKASPAFVPLTAGGRPEREAGIVLERTGGMRLRLPESIAAERLAAIVRALESEEAS
jgi:hypothetical protein